MDTQEREFIPLAMLNALAYCPRRFAYEHLHAEMLVNEFVLEGQLRHQVSDSGLKTWHDGGVQQRSLYVWNRELGIAGRADVIEEHDGVLIPVEHKRGRLNRWRNDHVQLCAQALCLESMLGVTITSGAIFSWAARRRETVIFDAELRTWTLAIIDQAHQLCASGELPPPLEQKAKCRDCSLKPLCLPDEVRLLNR